MAEHLHAWFAVDLVDGVFRAARHRMLEPHGDAAVIHGGGEADLPGEQSPGSTVGNNRIIAILLGLLEHPRVTRRAAEEGQRSTCSEDSTARGRMSIPRAAAR
jgi:hypothetical protein